MATRSKKRSSRRAEGLKDSDYDHEISLVDRDAAERSVQLWNTETADFAPRTSTEPLSPNEQPDSSSNPSPTHEEPPQQNGGANGASLALPDLQAQDTHTTGPSIEIQGATPAPEAEPVDTTRAENRQSRKSLVPERESAIDILFENERGGFLCGYALFSSKALGNLDPPPWTNAYHKASPTDINTAQCPDPSWEWAWPSWRINMDEGVDEGGWKYSFMFSKKFRWHGPKWYNSFVRRRAWIRKRVRKDPEDVSADPHMLNTDYFSVRPASEAASRAGSVRGRAGSRLSKGSGLSVASDAGTELDDDLNITDIDILLMVVRRSRIDREKIEAVGRYLQQGQDLERLQDEMHEIMKTFVFQASRGILLGRLKAVYEETVTAHEKENGAASEEVRARRANLEAAIRHADEEVRRLSYWSDVKGVPGGEEATEGKNEADSCR